MLIPDSFTSLVFLKRLLMVLLLVVTLPSMALAQASPQTALDDYISTQDLSYNFALAGPPVAGVGYTFYLIYMSSQQWRNPAEVDRIQWTHWMGMVVPDEVATDTGMLVVVGGSNTGLPDIDAEEIALATGIATTSHSVVTVLGQVPNQPLFFADDPFAHSEDELVAYSFDKALDTGDWLWPAYLPMTKAAVRAMDTVQSLSSMTSPIPVSRFVVTGFSKRGGTSWFTAIVDPRVRAVAPGVYDILNMTEQVEHHFSAYGFYSDALNDYVHYNILRRVRTPEGQALMQVVDPYSYRDRLSMPKFMLNSAGDSFFPSDSARFYFDTLPGEKLLRYVPNTGHKLEDQDGKVDDALGSLISWYLAVLSDLPRPQIHWAHDSGKLVIQTDQPPMYVRFWQAYNPLARDFRLETYGRNWFPQLVIPTNGRYEVTVPAPIVGWSAYFVDLIYPGIGGLPQTYSTPIFISPNSLAHEVSDPLGTPYESDFWTRQIRVALGAHGNAIIPAETLAGYFPIPLFDQYINSIEDAATIFLTNHHTKANRAKRECLALRLNVRNGQLGWYTSLRLKEDDDEDDVSIAASKKLWQYYAIAHNAYLAGNHKQAGKICHELIDD